MSIYDSFLPALRAGILYAHCLARYMGLDGIYYPYEIAGVWDRSPAIERLVAAGLASDADRKGVWAPCEPPGVQPHERLFFAANIPIDNGQALPVVLMFTQNTTRGFQRLETDQWVMLPHVMSPVDRDYTWQNNIQLFNRPDVPYINVHIWQDTNSDGNQT